MLLCFFVLYKKITVMSHKEISRRQFIQTGAMGAAVVLSGCSTSSKYTEFKAHGLATSILGKTGVTIPRIAFGCGSRFLAATTDDGLEMLEYALDHGLYYWDTAHSYVNQETGETSEGRLGRLLKTRRSEVFLGTKLGAREPEEMKRQFETSLERLQTDHVDVLNIHSISSLEDAQNLDALIALLEMWREQKMTRFIGFTGHTTAAGMAHAAGNYKFDFMLCALNHYQKGEQPFEKDALGMAAKRKMGIMVMKVIRPREMVTALKPEQLIRYALTLPEPHGAIISMQKLEEVKANIELLKTYQPLNQKEMESLSIALDPWYQSQELPWMQSDYRDGRLT